MTKKILFLFAGAAVGLSSALLDAAQITWGPAIDTVSKANLIEGNVVIALNGGSASPLITGGGAGGTTEYQFAAANFTALGLGTFQADVGGPTAGSRVDENAYNPEVLTSTGDVSFDALVQSFTDSFGSPAGITAGTVTLNGLADGGSYQIQLFYNDQRAASDARSMTFGDNLGGSVSVAGGDTTAGVQTNHYGQHAIGSFIADGTSQDLTIDAVNAGNIHFTAILVTGPPGGNLPPKFEEFSYVFDIHDGDEVGTLVGTVVAIDLDNAPSPLAYSITEGNTGDTFSIDSATGEILVAAAIDIEVETTYTLTVEASDGEDSDLTTVWVDVYPAAAPPVDVEFAGSVLNQANWVTQAFGNAAYVFANTDDNDEAAGAYKRGGVIYTSDESPDVSQTVMFTRTASSMTAWNQKGSNTGNPLIEALNAELENPDGGVFKSGVFYSFGLASNDPAEVCTLTFDQAAPDGYRLGILLGATEVQATPVTIGETSGNLSDIPYLIQVDTVQAATTQSALEVPAAPQWLTSGAEDPTTGVPQADWYFFDLSGIEAGAVVTISAARIYSGGSHKFCPINGLVLSSDSIAPPSGLVITGVKREGNVFTIDFVGEPGVSDWKIMAGTDLLSFPIDETPATIPEGPAGVYKAEIDVTGDPDAYFMRVER